MLNYKDFYFRFGINKPFQVTERVFDTLSFHFPRNITFHHVQGSDGALFPDENLPYFQEIDAQIPVQHIEQLKSLLGGARKQPTPTTNLITEFHRAHRHFRKMGSVQSALKNENVPDVVNYGIIPLLYKYPSGTLESYYEWKNLETTVWAGIKENLTLSSRQNFRTIQLPDVLPSIVSLMKYKTPIDAATLKLFDTYEKLCLLEFCRWLDPKTRKDSLLSIFDDQALDKIDVVFEYKGKWGILNLGKLNGWETGKSDGKASVVKLDASQVQKLFLRFLMTIQSPTIPINQTDVSSSLVEKVSLIPKDSPDDLEETIDEDEENEEEIKADKTPIPISTPEAPLNQQNDKKEEEEVEKSEAIKLLEEIDEDLEALTDIEKLSSSKTIETTSATIDVNQAVYSDISTEELLRKDIELQAEYTLLSATDYKNKLKSLKTLNRFKNPFDPSVSVEEYVKILPEDLALPEGGEKFQDQASVFDKSMLGSTLVKYDEKYVKKILPKDILGMVVHLQRGRLIVQDYTVETERSILGDYDIHTVKIQPIEGQPSTLTFRLPRVDEEGNFTSNGNKYKMRKQRSTAPIQKLDPWEVALVSYYGKLFVRRSEKRKDDPDYWLYNKIMSLLNEGGSSKLISAAPSDVFDANFKAPRIYSGMAKYFKSITTDEALFLFNKSEREALFKSIIAERIKGEPWYQYLYFNTLESDGFTVVGKTLTNLPIVVDKNDEFHVISMSDPRPTGRPSYKYQPIGTLYQLLGISEQDSPKAFTNLSLFGKEVPVGIVLAYFLGFDNLLSFLKISYRTLEGKNVTNLQDHEYVVSFKDKKFIFSTKDKTATLLLGGFLDYQKALKKYAYEAFNDKNVYLNLLVDGGLGVRHLRELDLLNRLFVDPITKGLLEEMKEPTTFQGLLVRATEMLRYDQKDNRIRYKGYERMAGAIYRETIRSLRDFNSKNVRGKSKIEMHPYAVWSLITQDATVKLCEDINPIQNLKEQEAATLVGEGGQSKDTIKKDARIFQKSDMGVVSESTVDSGDVGINIFLSANPRLKNLRGMVATDDFNFDKNGASSLVSTSALLSPGAMKDD